MGSLQWFLFVYVLGALTFVPLLIGLLFLHAYYTLPPASLEAHDAGTPLPRDDDPALLLRPEDHDGEKSILRTATDDLAEKFHRKHDSDVAAGYFAVCREFVPGGVNGKPPDKLTAAGEVVPQESPSVYQSMYRSIFDRTQKPTIEPNKSKDGAGKTANNKKANNVFYVVLRHGHLMLYDDIQQLEVRYVISLEYHDVDVYGGGEVVPEGELWIKRHAIRLKRKQTRTRETASPLPFFFFGENQSEKEDFYFALLKNQDNSTTEDLPATQEFDVDHIVTLVQKLHSSEEHLQTRWLNALIGRLFLAMYKTPELEGFIRTKLTKKISRVKKPNFITKLALRKIDLGTGAPFVTNPRLKDLTVNGDCTVEADINYSGHVRIEIAATARIELGSRFKPREVDMVLAATCKNLQGHILVRFKPPPSNRLWFSFEKMPQMDLVLEPVVSTRQITYTFVLRAIESRIREVVAESICLPFWDDVPFLDTRGQRYRGGIWQREAEPTTSTDIPNEAPEDEAEAEAEAEAGGSGARTPAEFGRDDRVMSMPVLADCSGKPPAKGNTGKKSISSLNDFLGMKSSEGVDKPESSTPRLMRSTSFASAANPAITANHADANSPTRDSDPTSKRESVATFLKDLSARSTSGNPSPSESQAGTPPVESSMATAMKGVQRSSSNSSKVSAEDLLSADTQMDSVGSPLPESVPVSKRASLHSSDSNSLLDGREERPKSSKSFAQAAKSLTSTDRKQALASVNAAAAAAQKWGWGVLARNRQREAQAAAERGVNDVAATTTTTRPPMGRGRPLPPPGMPLPPPEKPLRSNTFTAPKRRPVPPPLLPSRPESDGTNEGIGARPSPKPPLPQRRRRQSSMQTNNLPEDEVLVVEAPTESAPTTPAADEHHDDFFGHGETTAVDAEMQESGTVPRSESPEPLPEAEKEELRRREVGMYT